MSNDTSKILGVVILGRHGDRLGFYQNSNTYSPSSTSITPLGTREELLLGQKLRSIYLNVSSPSNLPSMNATFADPTQLWIRADAGGEGGLIFNSAVAMLQGFYPANSKYEDELANGTSFEGALNGYQYVPIESVEPRNDISLESWTSCNTFNNSVNAFYASPQFAQKNQASQLFLNQLPQYLDGRPVSLQDIWNIYDFMNVESIHNEAFFKNLPATFLAQARDLANWHEYNIFSSPQNNGIGNIAGQSILPSIIHGFNKIINATDPVKFVYQAVSYKPFISLFNMTGAAQAHPELAGIVNTAAALAFEVRQSPGGGEPFIRFNFKNGSDNWDFQTYTYLGGNGDVPISTFVNTLAPSVINSTAQWCSVCQNTQDRGCDALTLAASRRGPISPLGAGFLGAGILAALVLAVFGLLIFRGLVAFGRRRYDHGSQDTLERRPSPQKL